MSYDFFSYFFRNYYFLYSLPSVLMVFLLVLISYLFVTYSREHDSEQPVMKELSETSAAKPVTGSKQVNPDLSLDRDIIPWLEIRHYYPELLSSSLH